MNDKKEEKRRKFSRFIKKNAILFCIIAIIGLGVWYIISLPPIPEGDIISRTGIHWHPELSIIIQGKKQEIPANIGLGVVEKPIHTHDSTGQIHLEFQGLVRKNDIKLGKFFDVWGKKFNRNQIFDYANGNEGIIKMFVNGKPNEEFENYIMNDKDKIEIRYEK